ncbi:MAG TPA: hypothetical protein H9795_05315 [Candidatus Fournierella merdigallinarum]|nr:hypothetical protein [Candidatus Fournierella merdigallinarum]
MVDHPPLRADGGEMVGRASVHTVCSFLQSGNYAVIALLVFYSIQFSYCENVFCQPGGKIKTSRHPTVRMGRVSANKKSPLRARVVSQHEASLFHFLWFWCITTSVAGMGRMGRRK